MLTAHALSPEALKKSVELGARAYLPKEKLGEIVPFLEDVLRYDFVPGWKRLYEKMKVFLIISLSRIGRKIQVSIGRSGESGDPRGSD